MEEIARSVGASGQSRNSAREIKPGQIYVRITAFILRIAVGLLFTYAGASKALNPDSFIADIRRFQLVPDFFVTPIAIYLPYLEIFTGLALITCVFYCGGLLLAIGTLFAFSAGLASAWARGLNITCGCFGKGFGDLPVEWALLRNGVLMVICLGLAMDAFRNRQISATSLCHSEK
jgi:uncharacterized membrane protein YphA (DoxX/SURF4 family)